MQKYEIRIFHSLVSYHNVQQKHTNEQKKKGDFKADIRVCM